jgi:hypothetical protein
MGYKTYSKVRMCKLCLIRFLFKTRRCFIAIAFQLFFKLYNYEGPRKPCGTEIKWGTWSANLCWWCKSIWVDIDTIKKNTETLTDGSNEVGLEANAEKSRCTLMSRHQNAEQNDNINIANRSFCKCGPVQISGDESNKSKLIQEETKRRFNSYSACYQSVQNFCLPLCCLQT